MVLLVVLVVRQFLVEAFKIPSGSMEPALLGNPYNGDRVLSWKPSVKWMSPSRWSVVVFEKEPRTEREIMANEGSANYIKRMVGLPGETVVIAGGDIFTSKAGPDATDFRIERKPPALQESLWHTVYEDDLSGTWKVPGWEVEPAQCGLVLHGGAIHGSSGEELWARLARCHYDDDGGVVTNLYVRRAKVRVVCPACARAALEETNVTAPDAADPRLAGFDVNVRTGRTRVKCPVCGGEVNLLTDDAFAGLARSFACPSCLRPLAGRIADLASGGCPHCGGDVVEAANAAFCPEKGDLFGTGPRLVKCPGCGAAEVVTRREAPGRKCPACGAELVAVRAFADNPSGRYPASREDEVPVSDLRLSFTVEPEALDGWVLAEIALGGERCLAEVPLARELGGEALVRGPRGLSAKGVIPDDAFAAWKTTAVSLAHVDQTVVLDVGGREVVRARYESPWQDRIGSAAAGEGRRRANGVRLGLRAARARLSRPRVERDIHYLSRGSPPFVQFYDAERARWLDVPPSAPMGRPDASAPAVRVVLGGSDYMMIGDNSPSSYDSRNWGPVGARSLVGRALLRFWPPHRMGLLR